MAQSGPEPTLIETPLSTSLGVESVRLPGGERMGLVGASLLFGNGEGWWFGPAVYGAASGRRGGLFVGGAELQRRWTFGAHRVSVGLFAGGGGGASLPVGGGLMLRPAVTFWQDFGGWQAGLSWSSVHLPGGDVSSRQLGLVAAWDGAFRAADASHAGEPFTVRGRSGIGIDRVLVTASAYRVDDAATSSTRRVGLAGARFERQDAGSDWTWTLEGAGAASGGSAGYMEILAGGGWSTTPWPSVAPGWRVGARGALGLAGGGAIATGGGVVGKLALATSWRLSPTLTTGVEAGTLRSQGGALHAPFAQWWLGTDLEPRPGIDARLRRTEWVATLQHVGHAERRDGPARALDTVGIKFNRFVDDGLYVSGQVHSAYAGGAGAYSVGLLGAGWATSPRPNVWQGGVEVLAGAAGGGGVQTHGGALLQSVAWAGWRLNAGSQARIGVGTVRSMRPGLSSPVVELSWAWAWAQAAP
jgi:hypothetical protein